MKNKTLIMVLSILIVLALAAASFFIITGRDKAPDTQPDPKDQTSTPDLISEEAERMQPYFPDYTLEEMEEVLSQDTGLTAEEIEAIGSAFENAEIVPSDDPEDGTISIITSDGSVIYIDTNVTKDMSTDDLITKIVDGSLSSSDKPDNSNSEADSSEPVYRPNPDDPDEITQFEDGVFIPGEGFYYDDPDGDNASADDIINDKGNGGKTPGQGMSASN